MVGPFSLPFRKKENDTMQRNEQEMQFADPAWQLVSHGSMDLPASENPWFIPAEVNGPGWEKERKAPQGSGDASLSEQGDQEQGAVLPLGQQQQALSQNARHAGPRRRQQSGIWLLTIVFGIWLLLFLLFALGLLVARTGGSSSSSSASQPPLCANQQSKCP